ncbi:MAG TPA: type II 3-dehydroquinate dehydratase [Woeseiaceae bacterium]|nr:type II 3-dehydroquinate dehydratase [Woeseiaceae bacterium]
MASLLLINGPNLNLLGRREPSVYGSTSLHEIEQNLSERAAALGLELACFQSNAEHEIVGRIHKAAGDQVDFILLNPGAFTHTSIAIRDALQGVGIPFIEVHLSNTFAREEFRHHSFFSDIAAGCLFGFGAYGYELALLAAHARLANGPSGTANQSSNQASNQSSDSKR